MTRTLPPILAALALLALAPQAPGASRLVIRGAGFGHGIGMSQYGALGQAKAGRDHRQILATYYRDTAIGQTESRTVRVLLGSGRRAAFSGARRAAGRTLSASRTYTATATGLGRVVLRSASGRALATAASPLRVTGSNGSLRVGGSRYRGALELRATSVGGVLTVNAVGLEDYLRGVVPRESPASWPAAALEAQAVAARTYALTTSKNGNGFDHYPDTRSQVYGGASAETRSTDAAVRATRGQIVTYEGRPAVTYFFSTSGGRTEDVRNWFSGAAAKPWLVSVADPWDKVSPYHRWGPIRMTLADATRRLGGLVRGSLRRISVVRRGRSPRIMLADLVGSRGTTRVTGAQLRARFGTRDTWMTFSVVKDGERERIPADEPEAEAGGDAPPTDPATGGVISGQP